AEILHLSTRCSLCPRKRTCARLPRYVRSVQSRLNALLQNAALFDHLVGALLQEQRHVKAEGLGSLEVDHQFKLDRGLYGQFARLGALKDAISISCRAPIIIDNVDPIGQQAAMFSVETVRIDGRQAVASSKRSNLRATGVQEGIRHRDQATI